MNGDFARISFDPEQQFSRVLLQQGRVLLEADFNEQSAIHHHFLRSFIIDMVGRRWRPSSGFKLAANADGSDDVSIGSGHFYIDGILCDNPIARSYKTQPGPALPDNLEAPASDGFVAFLDCWERHLSAVQLPALREVALGGPDTASRAQVVWRVRLASRAGTKRELDKIAAALRTRGDSAGADRVQNALSVFNTLLDNFPANAALTAADAALAELDAAAPRMRARAQHDASDDEPCTIAADAEYRGRENQLYRVEIHAGGSGEEASFKWSRENASVVFAIAELNASRDDAGAVTATVRLDSLGRDSRGGLSEGDWVEPCGEFFDFALQTGPLGQVTAIDRSRNTLTLKLDGQSQTDLSLCTLLKRWDQRAGADRQGAIPVREAASADAPWQALERGVEIQFLPGAVYRPGDYWLIPARAGLRNVLWPLADGKAAAVAPHGTVHHRAAIGIAKKTGAQWNVADLDA
jgi:hypothetical protein